MDLNGKNILVTGGGGVGVGAGVCRVLSRCGATIVLNEIELEKAEAAAAGYSGAIPVAGDISKMDEVTGMFRDIRNKTGVLHGLVNNAGVGMTKVAHEATEEEFDRLFDTDIKGVWQVSREFVNLLLETGQTGNIVNISSVMARSIMPKYAVYAGAKSAVEGLTRGMAVELGGHNIRVNAVAPGYVHAEQNYELLSSWTDDPEQWVTDFVEKQQALPFDIDRDDCGNVVAFLLSDLSKSVTGQSIYVDAGTTVILGNRYITSRK